MASGVSTGFVLEATTTTGVCRGLEAAGAAVWCRPRCVDVDAPLADCASAFRAFFDQAEPVKLLSSFEDLGYSTPGGSSRREMFSVQLSHPARFPPFPWPPTQPALQRTAEEGFCVLRSLAVEIASALQLSDAVRDETDVFVRRDTGAGGDAPDYSPSALFARTYHLADIPEDVNACGAHTDSSLLTVVPLNRDNDGLQVLDQSSRTWLDLAPPPAADGSARFCILAGEALASLTEGKYTAAVHRVVRRSCDDAAQQQQQQQVRLSLPFQLRVSPALLPTTSLQPATILM
ncbi:oxidoreductase [Diplonema papillatum]|nr:oxidoreductase [Diplonema papillatum]